MDRASVAALAPDGAPPVLSRNGVRSTRHATADRADTELRADADQQQCHSCAPPLPEKLRTGRGAGADGLTMCAQPQPIDTARRCCDAVRPFRFRPRPLVKRQPNSKGRAGGACLGYERSICDRSRRTKERHGEGGPRGGGGGRRREGGRGGRWREVMRSEATYYACNELRVAGY